MSELRLACEECHKRKIRCRVSQRSSRGTCEACLENQRQCLFSLKSKTGRPRKEGTKDNARRRRPSPNLCQQSQEVTMSPAFLDEATSSGGLGAGQNTVQRLPSMSNQIDDYFSPTSGPNPLISSELSLFSTMERHTSERRKDFTVPQNLLSQDEDMANDTLMPSPLLPLAFDCQLLSENATDRNTVTNCFEDMPNASGKVASGSTDFLDVMQICHEIHKCSQDYSLNLCVEIERTKILAISCTIDKLLQKVLMIPQEQKNLQDRKEQYCWTILRVAVDEAVEITADLVSFNLQIGEQRSASRQCNRIIQADQWSSPIPSAELANSQLDIMMLLCRLDHSLFHFGAFIATQSQNQGSNSSCLTLCKSSSGSQSCRCQKTASLSRADQVRRQTWGLIEKLRDEWL